MPLFAWFLRRRFAVPWHLTLIALFAVPLVQTHATSAYIDLPANTAASVAVILAIEAFALPAPVTLSTLAVAGLAAAVAANMKALLHPIAALALFALALRALPVILPDLRAPSRRPRAVATLIGILLALPVVFATPLVNLVSYGNPGLLSRVQNVSCFGHSLPGTFGKRRTPLPRNGWRTRRGRSASPALSSK